MNKNLIRLTEKLKKISGKNYKIELYTDGYGLSLNKTIVANTINGITKYIKEELKKYI